MIYFSTHLVLAICVLGMYIGGAWNWLAVMILFVGFPFLEFITAKQQYAPKPVNNKLAELSLHLMSLSLAATLLYGFTQVQNAEKFSDLLGLTVSTGVLLGAFGITSAHELVHRRSAVSRAFGVFNLLMVNFAHWGIEHVFGHHKHVATLKDPATARKNEILYTFWVREYFSTHLSAFRINSFKVGLYLLTSVLVSVVLFFTLGMQYLLFWWGVSFVAILLLQTVDYIEHYGLLRKQKEDGSYYAFGIQHAWDTSSFLTNVVLFNLGLHSHHHLKAQIPFESLQVQEKSYKMPVGYSFMVLLALFPMFFIPIMNKRLEKLSATEAALS